MRKISNPIFKQKRKCSKTLKKVVDIISYIFVGILISVLAIMFLSHVITIAFMIIRHTTGYYTPFMNQVIERVSKLDQKAIKMWANS